MFSVIPRKKRKYGLPTAISLPSQPPKTKTLMNVYLRAKISFVILFGLFIMLRDRFFAIPTIFTNKVYCVKSAPLEPLEVRFPERPSCFHTALPIGEYVSQEQDDPIVGLPTRERTTLVIMSSSLNKVKNLEKLLPLYGDMSFVIDRVLVLWNNQEECPPQMPIHTKVDMFIISQNAGSMNNRMGEDVLKYTRTRSILHTTDDVFLPKKYIRHMTYNWVINGIDSIVGDLKDGVYAHPSTEGYLDVLFEEHKESDKKRYNIVSTRSLIMGKKWLEKYNKDLLMLRFVDLHLDCEHILLSAFFRKNTRRNDPMFIAIPKEYQRKELPDYGGVDENTYTYKDQENTCILKAMEYFGKDIWDPKNIAL
mmetsp:Transcript_26182/g.52168  ORF Transcript_26182/g.52168 Transcript_26182/m.52168 type:complete len:365 (+) Transcript_26182:267-1361(+)